MTDNPYSTPELLQSNDRSAASAAVTGPAISLMVVSIVSLLVVGMAMCFSLFLLVSGTAENLPQPGIGVSKPAQIGVRVIWGLVIFVSNATVLMGAIKMRNLQS